MIFISRSSPVLAEVRLTERRHDNHRAVTRFVAAREEAAFGRVLPDGKARTRRPPRVEDLGIRPRLGPDPLEQIEDEAVDGPGHGGRVAPRLTCSGSDEHR